jgi:mannose-6-phosphate isomerase-like protein (cupin superfamily)
MVSIVPSGSGTRLAGVLVKVASDETQGAYTVLELLLPPGAAAPLHVHQREDEIFYVIEGECAIRFEDQEQIASAGSVVRLPKGTAHAFGNPGTVPTRLLITAVPGGLDRYFGELDALGQGATREQVDAINQKYEIRFF